jgi:hypothetical protein
MTQPRDDALKAMRKDRREKVANLRIVDHLSWREIGREVGITHVAAMKDFRKWLATPVDAQRVEEVRAEEELNLQRNAQENELLKRRIRRMMHPFDEKNNPRVVSAQIVLECTLALQRCIRETTRISESRRRLHGADAPVVVTGKVEHEHQHRVAVAAVSFEECLRVGRENAGLLPQTIEHAAVSDMPQ